MNLDELDVILGDAYPRCPHCGEPLNDAGPDLSPYLVCDCCDIAHIRW